MVTNVKCVGKWPVFPFYISLELVEEEYEVILGQLDILVINIHNLIIQCIKKINTFYLHVAGRNSSLLGGF